MKYGDTLRQRSIPEWGHYNIDYDYLKDLIKRNTTAGTGRALSIPGQGAPTEKAFSDTFFTVLKAQHDRINLFIKSKSGEIERRLDYIGKQLAQLQARHSGEQKNVHLPVRTVERYAKIDADVSSAGEEIRSLSRFRVAQKTGFYKILKKYKRWTKDRELERRFKQEVSSAQESFFQLDLGYLLDQYIDVLGAVRAPLALSGASGPEIESSQRSAPSQISEFIDEGSELDFDVALTSVPLGFRGTRATYWVHADNVLEVELLLLQHMRLYNPKATRTVDSRGFTPTRRTSSATASKHFGNQDDVGLVVLDHPEMFAHKENASTIGSSEEKAGSTGAVASGIARWTASDEAAVVTGLDVIRDVRDGDKITIAKLNRKRLESFLNPNTPFHKDDLQNDLPDNLTAIRTWLAAHKEAKPIAGICLKRLRFLGLHNNSAGGLWASLDSNITMKESLHKSTANDDWVSDARTDSLPFPHAVLDVRREGIQSTGLIQALDRSHLVERVRGFSLEAHAVWECCKPKNMSSPIWLPILDRDIRKLPALVKRRPRRTPGARDGNSTPPMSSTSATSVSPFAGNGETSATSVSEFVDPPPLRAFRKKRKLNFATQRSTPEPTPRYWNEYDNPESGDEGYYIYVDPNASVKFPGQELLESWVRATKKLFGLHTYNQEVFTPTEGSTSDGEDSLDEVSSPNRQNYGTITSNSTGRAHTSYFSSLFRSLRNPQHDVQVRRRTELERQSLLTEIQLRLHEREMAKFQLYASCLCAAAVLDVILVVMTTTSRRKLRGEVDSAVILGVICNLLCLLVAVTSMRTRHEPLSLFHQASVFLAVITMVVVDALLFRWALNL